MEVRISKTLVLILSNFFNKFNDFDLSKKVEYGNLEAISIILNLASNSTPFLESIKNKVNNDNNELKIIKDIFNSYLKYFQSNKKDRVTEFLNDIFCVLSSNFRFKISEKDIEDFLFSIYNHSIDKNKIDLYYLLLNYIESNELDFFREPLDFISEKINYLLSHHITNNILSLDPNIFKTFLVYIPIIISEIQENLNIYSMENDINTFTTDFEKLLLIIRRAKAVKNAKIKAKKQSEIIDPQLRVLEKIWDKENWTQESHGKYTNFAYYIKGLYNNNSEILAEIDREVKFLSFDSIRFHISNYDKSKKI